MKMKQVLVSVNRGDVFKWTRASTYGCAALLIVDKDVSERHIDVPFISCSSMNWTGSLHWLSSKLEVGDIVYVGTIDNIVL